MVIKKKISKQKQAPSKGSTKKPAPETVVKKATTSQEKPNEETKEKVIKLKKDDDSDKKIDLNDLLKEKEEEIENLKKAALYDKAETDNLRKRMFKEKSELKTHLYRDLVTRILPVIDNLERAVAHIETSTKEVMQEGVAMTLVLFKDVFGGLTIKQFDSIGKTFDPEFHEAMSREPKEDIDENIITQEFVKGYMIGDKLLRPAQVVVSYKESTEDKKAGNDIEDKTKKENSTQKEN